MLECYGWYARNPILSKYEITQPLSSVIMSVKNVLIKQYSWQPLLFQKNLTLQNERAKIFSQTKYL
jgi:hypothetical protein